jgi:hypothetical protein
MDVSKKSRIIRRLRRLTELTGGGYLSYLDTEAGLNAQPGVMAHPALQSIPSLAAVSCPHKRGYFAGRWLLDSSDNGG